MDDQLILAAVRRAGLHGGAAHRGAPLRAVLAHLGITRRTTSARAVRRRLEELEQRGAVRRSRVHGVAVWGLAPAGTRRLAAAERAGRGPVLGESPQHLAWRRGRLAAGQELARFAARLDAGLAEAEEMLATLPAGAGAAPHSDRWFALGHRLLGDCRRLGSAWHCLHEWPEPSDERADRDEPGPGEPPALRALRAGRRNVTLWAEPD
ncbi:MAG: hypothetical protein QOK19_103 [Solirubrobacteraceae bacterium]|jgi:hypothetical protein|nr:hypothetical protein [Solirubrobacteraceae bacterium]